ncbi:MAG: CotS family spore coat protein [Lachnospiraceae bacterium]|nr:CotS family spore coat protein [Lachnospiraceae bacterium]
MNERSLEVLSQYELDVNRTARGRGAYLLWTDKGFFQFIEYNGTEGRLQFEAELLDYIKEAGFERVDNIYKTSEEKLYSEDEYGTKYILKRWYDGRECDAKKQSDIVAAVQTLACLHISTSDVKRESIRASAPLDTSILEEYEKHNAELKRVRSFMRGRARKTQFEYDVLENFDEYYGYAMESYLAMKESQEKNMLRHANDACNICHGTYNHHNIIVDGNNMSVVNFNRSVKGMQIKDLYFFLRKIMEKNDWNIQLGALILDKYNVIKPLTKNELNVLRVMVSYPEKFWKVLNQYNNSNKSWIPDKNIEKLSAVYRQQELKRHFIGQVMA